MATTFDALLNFSKTALVSTLAAGALSFSVSSGTGSLFPNPAVSGEYNIVLWNSTDYQRAEDDPYKEILRVTARASDVFTVLRGQESTSDVNHTIAGRTYRIALVVTAKSLSDIHTAVNARGELAGNNSWSGTNTFSTTTTFSGLTATTVPYLNASKVLTSSAVTPTELGYVSGVTSAIQTQMNLKAPLASPTFTGTASFTGNIVMSAAIGIISADTSDGSDSKAVLLNGGGGTSYNVTRGAYIYCLGNEYGGAGLGGAIAIVGGDTANGNVGLYTGNGSGSVVNRLNIAPVTGVISIYNSLGVNVVSPIGRFQVTTGDTGTVTDYAFVKTSGVIANQGGLLIGNAANGTTAYRALKITATYAGTPASTSATLGFVDEAATETFLSNANGHMNFYHNSGAGYVNFNTLITCQSSISSIFSNVITTSNATLTTLTQGLTIAGNLVSTPYVSDGYAAGITWSSTTDNAAKPKAAIICKTAGDGTYVYIGTSSDYATGITQLGFAVGPGGKTFFQASTTTHASMNVASGTAPTTPSTGDIYRTSGNLIDYDGTAAKYFVLAGNATKTTAGAPYTNDGYITLHIGGAAIKFMTTA